MTALTEWGGEVEVAIGLARTFPGGEWDTSTWDVSEWEQTDTALGDWLDVTCETLDGIELKAGTTSVEGVIDRWEAATCSLSLYGPQFDPRTGQWAGLLAPGLPVRVRWRPRESPEPNPHPNLLRSDDAASMEASAGGWVNVANASSVGRSVTHALDGVASLAVASAVSNWQVRIDVGAVALANGAPAAPSTTYTFTGWVWSPVAAQFSLGFVPLTSAGATGVGGTTYAALQSVPAQTWTSLRAVLTTPATAAIANLVPALRSSGLPTTGSTVWLDKAGVFLGDVADSEWHLPSWQPEPAWTPVFLGTVADAGYKWDPQALTASLDCDDLTAELVAYVQEAYDVPMGTGERASERISRLADLAMVGATARDITGGGEAMQAASLGGSIWGQMLDTADSDLGLVWLKRNGQVAYRPGGRVREIVDAGAELAGCPVMDAHPDAIQYANLRHADPTVLRNVVTISRGKPFVADGSPDPPEPPVAYRRDDPSIARFRPHSYKRTDLLHASDSWSESLADAVIANGAWPTTAPLEAVMDTRAASDLRIAAVLLGMEAEDVFTVWDALVPTTAWRMVVHGWAVTLSRFHVHGSIFMSDLSGWGAAGEWDDPDTEGAGWDVSAWALTGVDPIPARKKEHLWL